MKPEEAKELLVSCVIFCCNECNNRHRGCEDMEKLKDFSDTVLGTLEKQIPKKPIRASDRLTRKQVWICPVCGGSGDDEEIDRLFREEFGHEKYCSDCGQALDWSKP